MSHLNRSRFNTNPSIKALPSQFRIGHSSSPSSRSTRLCTTTSVRQITTRLSIHQITSQCLPVTAWLMLGSARPFQSLLVRLNSHHGAPLLNTVSITATSALWASYRQIRWARCPESVSSRVDWRVSYSLFLSSPHHPCINQVIHQHCT